MKTSSVIETLEPRIAPATVITFIDVDGDAVTLKIFTTSIVATSRTPAGLGEQLLLLDLSDPSNDGANVTTVVRKAPTGDGLVNIGRINGGANDLGRVMIKGDLGVIDCGDTDFSDPALKSLKVRSMGRFGTGTGAPDLQSDVSGAIRSFKIAGDFKDALVLVSASGASEKGTIGTLTIGGSMIGGATANSGFIQATGDIGSVKIKRDVVGGDPGLPNSGGILCGGAIKSLSIGGSLLEGASFSGNFAMGPTKIGGNLDGRLLNVGGPVTIGGTVTGVLNSNFDVVSIKIGGDLNSRAQFTGTVHTLTIGGSLRGEFSSLNGSLGTVKIRRDFVDGAIPGNLQGATIGAVTIGGSMIGSNIIAFTDIGPVRIAGDVVGVGSFSGSITTALGTGKITSVAIRGSLIGDGSQSGMIFTPGDLGPVKIGRDLIGVSIFGTDASVQKSGYIQADRIARVTIGGSIVTGIDSSTAGSLSENASIRVNDDIGPIIVKGSLIGHATADGSNVVCISARGQETLAPGVVKDVAIKSIKIGGRVERALILAGYTPVLQATNADAQIGPVSVGGDWIESDLIAGVVSTDANFGNGDDTKINTAGAKDDADNTGAISKIASLTIKGIAMGTGASNDARLFGIEAQRIGALKVGGRTIPLDAGASNDLFAGRHILGATRGTSDIDGFDFHAFEVA
jgi:hypothetical protein